MMHRLMLLLFWGGRREKEDRVQTLRSSLWEEAGVGTGSLPSGHRKATVEIGGGVFVDCCRYCCCGVVGCGLPWCSGLLS